MGTGKETRKLLLYRLSRLVKVLYPNTRTSDPYPEYQETIFGHLDAEEQLLYKDLVHVLTVLNGIARMTADKQLVSVQTDHLNALQMILPKELQLTPGILEAHEKLLAIYNENPFTYIEACSRLKVSRTSLKRMLKPLQLYGLVRKHQPGKNKKTLLQVIATTTEREPGMFETMQGDWKDFVGFVEM